jgi:hypothetical protein
MSPRSAAARVAAPRTGAARTTADRAATTAKPTTAKPATAKPTTAKPTTGARPELRVVPSVPVRRVSTRPARVSTERRAPFVLLVVAMLVGTTLGLLVLSTAINVNSIKATDLRRANAEAALEVQALRERVVANGTPAALAMAATAAGLVPAGSAAYLVIAPDGSSTLRGTVSPAPEPVKSQQVPADKD